jgi:hypothetical protein
MGDEDLIESTMPVPRLALLTAATFGPLTLSAKPARFHYADPCATRDGVTDVTYAQLTTP